MPAPSPQPNMFAGEEGLTFGLRFWLLAVLTGVATGLAAGALMLLLRAVQHWAYDYAAGTFLDAVQHASPLRRVAVLACAGALAGFALSIMERIGGEHAGGLATSIWFRSGRLPALRNFATGALSITIVGMGASLGREAAPKEYGATIASKLSQWARLPRAQRRVLAACGAGAGMGAVYNVPLGGALFGLEVLLGRLELPLVLPALATSLIATATSWLLIPNQVTYSVPRFPLAAPQVAWAVWAGPALGLAAVLYIRAISWASRHKPEGWKLAAAPFAIFTALGLLSIPFPQLLGNGKNVVQLAIEGALAVPLLGSLVILKPLATAACLRSGAPGGLFTPTMTLGALAGSLMGKAWDAAWPGAAPGSYALIGSAAMLAAATQGPVSSIVLVAELTRRVDPLLVPILLAVAGAGAATRILESRSIYSGRVPVHLPAAVPAGTAGTLGVEPGTAISAAAPYASVLERLLALDPHQPLSVVNERGEPVGTITRAGLHLSARDFGSPRQIATAFDLAGRGAGKNTPS